MDTRIKNLITALWAGQVKFLGIFVIILIISGCGQSKIIESYNELKEINENSRKDNIINKNMKLTSHAFQNNQTIPIKYTCDSSNINPPLTISDVLAKVKSLVLIVDDPDAPIGTWVHWTVWNINPGIREINENSVPEGAQEGITDFGRPGYGGPCPPSGTHRYLFKLYALDTKLNLDAGTKKSKLEEEMENHILDKAELIGLYSRQ